MTIERVGVIGSRSFTNGARVHAVLEAALSRASVVLSGGADGADKITQAYCAEKNVPFILFKPYFLLDPIAQYSVRHYFTRNKQIIDNSDRVIAFWDGESPGTKWGINYARKRGKPVLLVPKEVPDVLERS